MKTPQQKRGSKFFAVPKLKNLFKTAAFTIIGAATIMNADRISHIYNQSSNQGVAAVDRDLISIDSNMSGMWFSPQYNLIVSSDYIIENGRIPRSNALSYANLITPNITVNWDSDDSFTNAINDAETNIIRHIEQKAFTDKKLQDLLNKKRWDDNDRSAWCKEVGYVLQSFRTDTPALNEYRTEEDTGEQSRYFFGLLQDRHMNSLSHDIDNNSEEYEFDCEQMGVIDTALLHRVTQHFVPENNRPKYFYAVVNMEPFELNDEFVQHVITLAVSPETDQVLGMVEPIYEDNNFFGTTSSFEPTRTKVTFTDFIAGDILHLKNNMLFGFDMTPEAIKTFKDKNGLSPTKRQSQITGIRLALN